MPSLSEMSTEELLALRQQLAEQRMDLQQRIVDVSRQKGVDPALSLSVAHTESLFDPEATSPTGVKGLFQVTVPTGQRYGQTAQNRMDPEVSINAGVSELKRLLDANGGNVRKALAGYGDPKQGNYPDLVLAQYPRYAQMVGQGQAPPSLKDMATEDLLRLRDQLRGSAQSTPTPAPTPAPSAPPSSRPARQGPPPGPVQVQTPVPVGQMPNLKRGQLPSTQAFVSGDILEDVGSGAGQGMAPPGTLSQAAVETGKAAAPVAVSMLGGAGGAWLAARLAARYGLPLATSVLGGELLGSLGARKANVAAGFEEPGTTGDVLSVATPLAGRAVGGAIRAVGRNLPGSRVVAHEMGQEALEQLPGQYVPQEASAVLFQQAAQHNPPIPAPGLYQAAADILHHEQGLRPAFRSRPLLEAAGGLTDVIQQHHGLVPMQVLDDYRQRLGLMIQQATVENWPHRTGLQRLYATLYDDLERAAARGTPGAGILTQATAAFRKERALDELANLWMPGRGITTVQGDLVQVQGRSILNNFDRLVASNPRFVGSFEPGELPDIRATLQEVARLTARPPTSQGPLGGMARHALATTVGVGGVLHGNPVLGLVGGLSIEMAPDLIAAALQTAPGRAAVRQAFAQGGGRLTAAGLALINQAVRDQMGGQSPSTAPAEERTTPLPVGTFNDR